MNIYLLNADSNGSRCPASAPFLFVSCLYMDRLPRRSYASDRLGLHQPGHIQDSATRAFGARRRSDKDNEESSNSRSPWHIGTSSDSEHNTQYCDTCYDNRHTAGQYWYTQSKSQTEAFKKNHPDADAVVTKLEVARRVNKERDFS